MLEDTKSLRKSQTQKISESENKSNSENSESGTQQILSRAQKSAEDDKFSDSVLPWGHKVTFSYQ